MGKTVAVCGLDCASCGAFIAHKTNDDELRKKVAAEWSKAYGFAFVPAMINCTGCLSTGGVQIGHCAECEMRKCAVGKGLANCAACADYPCKTIEGFLNAVPEAKANLDALRGR